jgi:hypothetical protein
MRYLLGMLIALVMLIPTNVSAQNDTFLKKVYKDFLKYGTVYGAGEIRNSIEAPNPTYFVRTNDNGNIYSIPVVVDNTVKYPMDYRVGFGIRKLARFDYERKPRNYYDGTEDQLVFTAPSSAVTGFEYQFHREWERWMGRKFDNHRYFLKHTGKHHIVKAESRQVGRINLEYQSAEARARLPIGKKFSISGGAIFRTHDRAYGYNPISIWLNETDENGFAVNPWWTLGYQYGYDDIFYTQTNELGDTTSDWCWVGPDGTEVAHSDLAFRENVFPGLMNRFNEEAWSQLDRFGEIAPIIGFDFYHYKSNFWFHGYANWILPYHKYVMGDVAYSYLHRNGWNHEGHHEGHLNNNGDQWSDYSFGANLGWRVGKNIGIFIEGEYSKMWDSRLYQSTFGLNYSFR